MNAPVVYVLFALIGGALSTEVVLPDNLKPSVYDLSITVNLPPVGADIGNETTLESGKVKIDIIVVKPTSTILLHGEELYDVTVLFVGREFAFITPHIENGTIRIEAPYMLHTGELIILEIDYRFVLRLDQKGIYRATYSNLGELHHFALAQFVPNHARRVVPCFDDVKFPAVWRLTVEAPEVYNSFTNAAPLSTVSNGGIKKTVFKHSERIPPSHLNIIVGDYDPNYCVSKSKTDQ
uniref:Peptidase_M1_N domain-containing protein n=1 Tax=Panagrellus redivivus TaxID=6233 RepID=A0A7E5A0C5_PANRE